MTINIKFKGRDISTMIQNGRYNPTRTIAGAQTGSSLSGLPTGETMTLDWECPNSFGLTVNGQDLSKYYKAKNVEFNDTTNNIPIPDGVIGMKVFCIGGGGGGSGGNGGSMNTTITPGSWNQRNKNPDTWTPGNWVNGNYVPGRWDNWKWRNSYTNDGYNNAPTKNPESWNNSNQNIPVITNNPVIQGNRGAKGNYGEYKTILFNITNEKTFSVVIGDGGGGGAGGSFKEGNVGNPGNNGATGGLTKITIGNQSLTANAGTGGAGTTNNSNTNTNPTFNVPANHPPFNFNAGDGGNAGSTNKDTAGAGAAGRKGYCRVYYLY